MNKMDPQKALDGLINLIMSDEFTRENFPQVMEKIDALYERRYCPTTAALLAQKFGRGSYDLSPAVDKTIYGAYWRHGYKSMALDIRRVILHEGAHYLPNTFEFLHHLWYIVLGKIRSFALFMQRHQNERAELYHQLLPQPIAEELLEYT
jgi:hypothetical protein